MCLNRCRNSVNGIISKKMNRQDIINFIKDEFSVSEEHLWIRFPNYIVFRNQRNRKWFAIIADVDKNKLGLEGKERIDIISVKCGPILMGSLLRNKGYLPAYHMSKGNWITILLDGTVPENEIQDLIHLSYEIIEKKKK